MSYEKSDINILKGLDKEPRDERYHPDDLSEILNGEPDYSHLRLKETNVNVTISKEEIEAVLTAYDRGFGFLGEEKRQLLDSVIGKLKDQIHP
jgi:hypothetical protein